ncbi:hypothetical protein GCM10020001_073290 [Nonomuraea salmonea]
MVGEQALLDAVRRCWASLWTDRAVAYRARLRLDDSEVRIAVVVQRMVEAETAGVMFTANPVTGDRTQLVVDAGRGGWGRRSCRGWSPLTTTCSGRRARSWTSGRAAARSWSAARKAAASSTRARRGPVGRAVGRAMGRAVGRAVGWVPGPSGGRFRAPLDC